MTMSMSMTSPAMKMIQRKNDDDDIDMIHVKRLLLGDEYFAVYAPSVRLFKRKG